MDGCTRIGNEPDGGHNWPGFEVSKALGAGFLEHVYERAMLRGLTLRGVSAKTQASFPVCYKGQYVGEYCADLVSNTATMAIAASGASSCSDAGNPLAPLVLAPGTQGFVHIGRSDKIDNIQSGTVFQ